MAILKCKMCGGDLNITADEKIVECEFCGTTQTIPNGSDEKKTNLFNRANRLRIANEFDKAAGIYESIIAEFPDDAESYWGLCLCKFGVEYVDDPKTAKKIPTCHRTSFESIFDDENYKIAIEKSDAIAQEIYKEEATVIDNLQKDILSIVHKEEPFDVFICYKETDELGRRTQDSVLAQDIYDALTDKGFKVFFSKITLEDKLGKQYEPYIFAALNSARVMLAIGTKEEYYNAVWVKNEWNRYLALMESDKSKMLIPCYRDIDPYDMPQEFKNLQGQDMSKLGFLQDLVRGISKIVAPEQNNPANEEPAPTTSANATVDSLLKRAFMFLEDGNWKSAEEYCEKVLDIDPECAEAYLGKLLTGLHVKKQEELKSCEQPFDDNKNYQKFIRFANVTLKNEIEECINFINKRNENERLEKEEKEKTFKLHSDKKYEELKPYMEKAKKAKQLFLVHPILLTVYFAALKTNGSVVIEGSCDDHYEKLIGSWNDVSQICGDGNLIGLKTDGTVVGTDCHSLFGLGLEDPRWNNIKMISTNGVHIVGLKNDGTVVTVCRSSNSDAKTVSYYVEEWSDIVSIETLKPFIVVGLKSDGTVLAAGNIMKVGQCESWRNINSIFNAGACIVGLNDEGKPFTTGEKHYDIEDWNGIVDVVASHNIIAGLRKDGTVLISDTRILEHEELDVSNWIDIVALSLYDDGNREARIVGLKKDGTVVISGINNKGQCNVRDWKDIVAVYADSNETIGLKNDGTIISTNPDISDEYEELVNWKLFDSFDNYDCEVQTEIDKKKQKEYEEIKKQEEINKQQERYRNAGVCQYCGGSFKGLFTKTCIECGKKKDY